MVRSPTTDDSTDHPVKIALADEVMSATAPRRARDFMMTVPPKEMFY
jgi:hypothetical protein